MTKSKKARKAESRGERIGMSLRVTPKMKERLEQAAFQSGRSLSQEAEFRLDRSFDRQDLVGEVLTLAFGEVVGGLMLKIGNEESMRDAVRVAIPQHEGKYSYEVYVAVNKAMGLQPLSRERWEKMPEPPTDEEFDAALRAHEKLNRRGK